MVKTAGLYSGAGYSRTGIHLTQIQPGLFCFLGGRIEVSQLEGGSLASCHARGSILPHDMLKTLKSLFQYVSGGVDITHVMGSA